MTNRRPRVGREQPDHRAPEELAQRPLDALAPRIDCVTEVGDPCECDADGEPVDPAAQECAPFGPRRRALRKVFQISLGVAGAALSMGSSLIRKGGKDMNKKGRGATLGCRGHRTYRHRPTGMGVCVCNKQSGSGRCPRHRGYCNVHYP